jgi:hypothetical protein
MLLAQLQVVRLALCGQTVRLAGFTGAAGQGTGLPRVYRSWPVRWVWIVLDPGRSPYRSVRLV